ncbi:hypothetical protein [Gracilimonas mengyeensis]|uniref:Lipoprotein n=1 Tax=Gracilimonas mengyeensis TaxID=1302730 RepID=A0A521BGT6_9BACT|nr:hypothetical protein [Gracilimonas mengyeensis]SMO46305.1 hypothetical protein SAMN06265219_102285 [Gracilimonas mengyeensis]
MNFRISTLCLLVLAVLFGGGCSTLDKLSTAQTDRLKKNQFYKTYETKNMPSSTSAIGLLPVTVRPYLESPDFEYDRNNPLLIELTDTLNARLQRMNITTSVNEPLLATRKDGPGLYLGSSEGEHVPVGASIMREDHEKYPPMIIYRQKPGKKWKSESSQIMADHEVDYLLKVWISFAEYPKADKGLVKKQVLLGTHHEEEIRFFSAEDKPVEVLQLSGYLVDQKGNVVRAGAEGVIHNDTPFWLQVLDVKELIDDKTLKRLLEKERRKDLPGDPLTLDVALENLVAQLLDRDI